MTKISIENNDSPRVFVDTNVIIDALTKRDYNSNPSVVFLRYVISGNLKGYICLKQITDIYYILKKYCLNEMDRRSKIKLIIDTFETLPLFYGDLLATMKTEMNDFEDAILDEVARVNVIPYFVTNNIDDFQNSKSMVLTPEQFITLFQLDK